jgi:hypothetical protein
MRIRFNIELKETDLDEYKTQLPEPEKGRLYLNKVCKYPIHREYNTFFETPCSDYKKEFHFHWLYFASRSHIWLKRIEEFKGAPNHEKMTVDFPDDDLFDAFYDKWGLEPDEQKKELQDKCIGNCPLKQLSIDDFCEKYGGVRIELTNSIVYA